MKRKQQIMEALRKPGLMDVFLTDQEHETLANFGTTYRRYLEGEQPQTFTIIADTPEKKQQADDLGAVLSKLDAITGNQDRVNVVVLQKHKGKQYESVS